jgi:hypothetical protein
MNRIIVAAAAMCATAAPALAHDGAHLHPHGLEAGWALLAAALAFAALSGFAWWRR